MAKLRAWRADAVPIAGSSHLVVGLTTMFAASACGTGGFADLGRNDQIFVVSADGDSFRRITDDDAANRSLAWSPDGQRLAFVASTQGSGAIETIRPDGHDRKMLLRRPTLGGELTWSPDGKRLTFSSYREEPNITSLETVDVDGTTPQLIASFVMPFVAPLGPSWSPDSGRLAYARSVGTGPPRVPPDAGPDAVAIIPGTFKIVVSGLRNHQRAQRLTQASGGEWDPAGSREERRFCSPAGKDGGPPWSSVRPAIGRRSSRPASSTSRLTGRPRGVRSPSAACASPVIAAITSGSSTCARTRCGSSPTTCFPLVLPGHLTAGGSLTRRSPDSGSSALATARRRHSGAPVERRSAKWHGRPAEDGSRSLRERSRSTDGNLSSLF